jgi:hypothetical protein
MNETTLYYAFSTVSQTLGGVLGLVAAFVVIRLSGLSSEIASIVKDLRESIPLDMYTEIYSPPDAEPSVDRGWLGQYSSFFRAWAAVRQAQAGAFSHQRRSLGRAVGLQQTRDRLICDTRVAIGLTSVVILIALVGIAAAPWLACSRWRGAPALVVTIGGTAACLALFWRAISRALDD